MTEGNSNHAAIDLKQIALATAVVLATAAVGALLYFLIDILLLLFLGIVVAAALQPWHVKLCTLGVPRGLSVVLIYFVLIVVLIAVTLLIAPVVIEELTRFTTELPQAYAGLREQLRASNAGILRITGQRLPTYEALIASLVALSPTFFQSIFEVTASILTTLAYAVTVLALGIYWTLELPRVERLVVSLLPVQRRSPALTIWHEIESKLGGFIRGQFLVMVAVGVASGLGYAVIGLPNVLVLALLAGILEAVPMVGPVLAAVPALAAAMPLGPPTMVAVIGFALLVQLLENNLLVPRIMGGTVGTSALVGLVAVLAFGTLYGILGVFIAIPITAVIQVIVDRMVINRDTAAPVNPDSQLEALLARVRNVRQQLRVRLRARETRMGIDPDTADHIVDAADQQIEEAVEHIGKVITATQEQMALLPMDARAPIVEELDEATQHLEQAVEQIGKADESDGANGSAAEPSLDILREAAESIEGTMGRVQAVVALGQEPSAPAPIVNPGAAPPIGTTRRGDR